MSQPEQVVRVAASKLRVGMTIADLPIARGGVIDGVVANGKTTSVWMGDRLRTFKNTVMVAVLPD
ncbi:hypothetical protein E3_1730 [Rhodococcus phage E3]|uniref:hypothetical protein n=1 Tax=Rhodococcus phage E3 TaxID=1007869 RepID=UPI0002C6A7F2|nr:hypothetical protein M176_gp183 [Rhodococcus phage E3]AEQ21091.1 hypothetical protein E3_1730 [Rhodococcus phage E3]